MRLSKFLLIVALAGSIGLHWAVLQAVAWTTMFASNITCEDFSTAITHTFDGKHPCCLCKAIAAAKKSQKKSEALSLTIKMEFPPPAENFVLVAPPFYRPLVPENLSAGSFSSKPLLPPPRPSSVAA
jgi:hypothetical protein